MQILYIQIKNVFFRYKICLCYSLISNQFISSFYIYTFRPVEQKRNKGEELTKTIKSNHNKNIIIMKVTTPKTRKRGEKEEKKSPVSHRWRWKSLRVERRACWERVWMILWWNGNGEVAEFLHSFAEICASHQQRKFIMMTELPLFVALYLQHKVLVLLASFRLFAYK